MDAINEEFKSKLTCVYAANVILTTFTVAWGVYAKATREDFSPHSRASDSQL